MAEPKIRYDIEANATGDADVARLATALGQLDKAIDPVAAVRAQELATKLRELGDQQAAINTFVEIKSKSQAAGVALDEAQAAAQRAGQQLKNIEAPTRAQTGQMAKLADAVKAAKAEVVTQTAALEAARVALTDLGLSSTSVADGQRQVSAALRSTRTEAEAVVAAATESAVAMKRLEESAKLADAEFAELTASLRAAETAAAEFAAATERAGAASKDDVAAVRARVAAAERLIAVESELNAGQRQVAAARNTERAALLAEAQALLKVAAAARESQAATVATATAARQAGEAIAQAFSTVGIRSIDAIESEIVQTSAALTKLEAAARRGALGQDELARASGAAGVKLERLRAEILQVQATPSQFEALSSGINSIVSRFAGLGAAIATVGVAVRPVIEATVALDQMRRTLTTVTGSAEVAQQQIEFLRQIAQRSGQSFSATGESFAKFAASALKAGLSLKQTQDVFTAVALAAGNLGLSSEKVQRALEALGQMASKGVVGMEELRQQLGDALPGVLPLLAKELGLTTAELNKVVESGQLLASEAIPAIGRSIKSLEPAGGTVDGLVASWNRFVNVVKEAGTALADGPIGQAAGPVLLGLAQALGVLATIALSASEAMKLLGVSVLASLDALRGKASWEEAGRTISDFTAQSGARISAFLDRVDAIAGSSNAAGAALGALGRTAGFTGESFAKLTLEQQKLIDAATLAAQSAEKRVQAAKAEAEAITRVASLLGDENALRQASAEAAELQSKAAAEQLVADTALVASLQRQKQAVLENVAAGKLAADSVKALIEETDKKIAKAGADVEKTQAQADAARALAAQTRLAVEAIGDQSKRLDELREAVAQATAAQVTAARRFAEGKGSLDALKVATEQLATAKGVLRDAINDLDVALKRQTDTLKADLTIKRASLALDLEQARTAQARAIAQGNETAARQAGIRIAQIEQTLQKTNISGKLQEAEATLRYVATKEAELKALGQLTPERQQELDLLRKGAIAQTLEAAATRESIVLKDEALARLKGLVPAQDEHTAAVGRGTGAIGENTSALARNTGAMQDNAKASDSASTARKRYEDLLIATRGNMAGGSGLAGIPAAGVNDVFSDAGRAKRNADMPGMVPIDSIGDLIRRTPNGGITRTTEGQLNPPDNSGDWFLNTARAPEGPFGLGVWELTPAAIARGLVRNGITDPVRDPFGLQNPAPPGSIRDPFGLQQPAAPAGSTFHTASGGVGNNLQGGGVQITFNFGNRSYQVTAPSLNQAEALARELEAAYRLSGGG